MSTITTGDLTIIRHEMTDGTISVYRANRHLGLIYPALGYWVGPTDAARECKRCDNEASAIAYLASH